MSTTIYGVIEYKDISTPQIRWSLGTIFFPSTYSDIQEYLGMWEPKDSVVPLRGHPPESPFEDGPSSEYHNTFTALVLRGEALDRSYVEFDSNGQYRESDGVVLNEAGAERWLSLGSEWLDDEWRGGYRRISDPDMRHVNWITREEYKRAVDVAHLRSPKSPLGTHRAALAAMLSLEEDGYTGVRFVYGGM